jgi:hypothetical protein
MENAKRSTPVATRPVGSTSVSITKYTNNDAKREKYLSITGQFSVRFGSKCKMKKEE